MELVLAQYDVVDLVDNEQLISLLKEQRHGHKLCNVTIQRNNTD